MASCSQCGVDTQLYSNGTPICLACAETTPTIQDGQRNRTPGQVEPGKPANAQLLPD